MNAAWSTHSRIFYLSMCCSYGASLILILIMRELSIIREQMLGTSITALKRQWR